MEGDHPQAALEAATHPEREVVRNIAPYQLVKIGGKVVRHLRPTARVRGLNGIIRHYLWQSLGLLTES